MEYSKKILLNTIALYAKIIVKAIVSIFATRIALNRLGADDYGLYNLIAGVIVLLSFLNGALMISTQRFLSIAIGEKKNERLNSIFNVSLLIHIAFALIIGIAFLVCQPILFNVFLNIENDSLAAAIFVYNIMILSAVITIATIPYSATINAHEDMWYFALSEVLVIAFQLIAALSLLLINEHLLEYYTCLMLLSVFIGYVSKYFWCRVKYDETKISLRRMINRPLAKEMLGFVGWNTLGSTAVIVRNQGVAMVLNVFFGTLANAAYGIANQMNSLVLTFASTLTTVFTPSIIQSKGANDEKRMIYLALLSSKLSFALSTIMAIPVLMNLEWLLNVWLGEVPDNTLVFTECIIYAFLFTQLYPGINRAIYATGKIKWYQICITISLVSTIPLGMISYKLGAPIQSILWILVITQFFTFLITIYFAKLCIKLDVVKYLKTNALPNLFICIIVLLIGKVIAYLVGLNGMLLVLFTVGVMALYSCAFYYKILDLNERQVVLKHIVRLKK